MDVKDWAVQVRLLVVDSERRLRGVITTIDVVSALRRATERLLPNDWRAIQ